MTQADDETRSTAFEHIGDAATAITMLARLNGITIEPAPIDSFVDAVSRLSDAEVEFDRVERLLLALARAGVITDQQRFAMHALYLRQKARTKLSPAEIQRRRKADSHAKANARLEGQFSSPESETIFDGFIQGEIDTDELIEQLKARHGVR